MTGLLAMAAPATAWARAHWRVVAVGIGVAAVVVCAVAWQRDRVALQEARRQAEALGPLRAEIVSRTATQRQLEASVADLSVQIARVKSESPGAKIVTVYRWRTTHAVAGGSPRPPGPAPGSPSQPEGGACLLAQGDAGEIRVTAADLQTRAGNRVVVGRAECWRLRPEPATAVLSGEFSAAAGSETLTAEPLRPSSSAARPRWSLRAGPEWASLRPVPSGAVVGAGVRVIGGWWLEAEGRTSGGAALALRYEW